MRLEVITPSCGPPRATNWASSPECCCEAIAGFACLTASRLPLFERNRTAAIDRDFKSPRFHRAV